MKRIVQMLFVCGYVLFFSGCSADLAKDTKAMVFADVVAEVGTDVCGDFPEEFVEGAIGLDISSVRQGESACMYFFGEAYKFVSLTLYERPYGVQEDGLKNMGFYLSQDERIKVDHQIASADDDTIWSLFLRVDDGRFYSVNYAGGAITDDRLVDFAVAISERLTK